MKSRRISARYNFSRRSSRVSQTKGVEYGSAVIGTAGAILGTILGVLIAHLLTIDYSSKSEKRGIAMELIQQAENRLQLSRFVYINCDANEAEKKKIFEEKWDDYMANGVRVWTSNKLLNRRLVQNYFPNALDKFNDLDRSFSESHRHSYHEAFMDILRREGVISPCVFQNFEQDIYKDEAHLKYFADQLFADL